MLPTSRHWVLRPPLPAGALVEFPNVPPLLVHLLHNRGVTSAEDVHSFLADSPPPTADPMIMKGMAAAISRLGRAVGEREAVAVYADFDADGITAGALLADAFTALGITVVPYVPNRAEGYGLRAAALRSLADQGIKLVVTVDCGVNSALEVREARQAGLDVIITDHHLVDGVVPDAVAVINPRQPDCPYPFKSLAAVGVAFKLGQAMLRELPLRDGQRRLDVARRLLEFVALGTVADVVPLLGENRALVRHGLGAINRTTRPGLRALMASAGLRANDVKAGNIAFALAPRLNAAGRVGDAIAAYHLLLTTADDEAAVLARDLEEANQRRQRLMGDALEHARSVVLAAGALPKILVVGGSDFPAGIVGLVAGRLAEEFHRPALVYEQRVDECRGSARSVEGFDVAAALAVCRDLLDRFGGHVAAAGFTVQVANLEAFHRRLLDYADQRLDDGLLRPRVAIDAELALSEVNRDLYEQLARLAPFGHGNPSPTFLTRGVYVAAARCVGRQPPGHLRLDLHDGERYWPAIGFGMGEAATRIARRVDIVYTLELNEWQGRETIELQLRDWRPAV